MCSLCTILIWKYAFHILSFWCWMYCSNNLPPGLQFLIQIIVIKAFHVRLPHVSKKNNQHNFLLHKCFQETVHCVVTDRRNLSDLSERHVFLPRVEFLANPAIKSAPPSEHPKKVKNMFEVQKTLNTHRKQQKEGAFCPISLTDACLYTRPIYLYWKWRKREVGRDRSSKDL